MNSVEFKNITKKFGSFYANEDISFSVKKNSVHCILGENGAGKSTLMKILFGIYQQDSGIIKISGEEVKFSSPHDAIDKKIGMVHQHFMLIEDFTILENIILGNEITKGIKIDFEKTKSILNALIDKYNLGLEVDKKISEISISAQQKTEILKLLFRDSEILIFDEPTAVLSPVEVTEFFRIIDTFKKDGKTIILITHKLNEVRQISDKVSVLRRGKLVYETDNTEKNLDTDKLGNAIVGESQVKNVTVKTENISFNQDNDIICLKNIFFEKNNISVLNGLSLSLRKGEILGICGVEGNGQTEIVDLITGLEYNYKGEFIKHTDKISLVPDDRLKKGMIREFSIGENIILKNGNEKIISGKLIKKITGEIVKNYDVRVSEINSPLGSLSGGNQQKVIFAREIEPGNDVLIFSHPTRGVDINATIFIHSKIIDQRNSGKAVLLVSSDLDELLKLSDRLCVIYNGRIVKTYSQKDLAGFTEDKLHLEIDSSSNKQIFEEIGKFMTGINAGESDL
jgi:simple sugar transport system ATP-binding protein